ncbi:hypothetical protein [Deinococcus enclensis]|uniref:Uncharacterized protein n=1 Tax=Deinococcus enclensis TaxID=1049582 RepID=A0ABT9M921_9DEIO|nr:hypothetical protein [Deinococcus enclensis]MDP9763047.1 hypothetical protein [Deinococcus enclensis]
MKVASFLETLNTRMRRGHHHSGSMKWEYRGEQFTNADYEVSEREVKVHDLMQARSAVERYAD